MSTAVTAAPRLGRRLDEAFFARPVAQVAPDLIGCTLLVDGVGGVIVETERYQQDDPASHSFRGPGGRASVMYGPPGRVYVYCIYGLHWCANLVCEPEGEGAAVLLRALAPDHGLGAMRARRGALPDRLLCAGPGRLTQALGIDRDLNDTSATDAGARMTVHARVDDADLVTGPRIGISVAVDRPWRFGLAGSPHLSKPFPRR